MRICLYKYCEKDISNRVIQTKYCCSRHWKRQHYLNRIERCFIEKMKKIEERKKKIIEKKVPTIITPQAGRYQDLLRCNTMVMSNFK